MNLIQLFELQIKKSSGFVNLKVGHNYEGDMKCSENKLCEQLIKSKLTDLQNIRIKH